MGPPPPPPPVRVSRLHAPLLSRCPDNVPAFIRAHLLFREGGRSGIRGCVLRKKVGRKKNNRVNEEEKQPRGSLLSTMGKSRRSCASGENRAPLEHILSGRGATVKLSVKQQRQPMEETRAPPRSVMRQPGSRCDAGAVWRGRRGRGWWWRCQTDINEQAAQAALKVGTRDL